MQIEVITIKVKIGVNYRKNFKNRFRNKKN